MYMEAIVITRRNPPIICFKKVLNYGFGCIRANCVAAIHYEGLL